MHGFRVLRDGCSEPHQDYMIRNFDSIMLVFQGLGGFGKLRLWYLEHPSIQAKAHLGAGPINQQAGSFKMQKTAPSGPEYASMMDFRLDQGT